MCRDEEEELTDVLQQDGPAQRLAGEGVAWLTTSSSDGQPQSSPVWFIWDGTSLWLRSQAHAGKIRDIEANPRVAFHLADDGHGGNILTVEGTASFETEPPQLLDAYLAKYNDAIRNALQVTPEQLAADYPITIRIMHTHARLVTHSYGDARSDHYASRRPSAPTRHWLLPARPASRSLAAGAHGPDAEIRGTEPGSPIMRPIRIVRAAALGVALCIAATGCAFVTRSSVPSGGAPPEGNGASLLPSVSDDGRYTAFISAANNLVPGDANGQNDAFVTDHLAHTTTRVSIASNGNEANGPTLEAAISANVVRVLVGGLQPRAR